MKIAVVTGASSGMGREFAKQIDKLYRELDEIWVIARRKERLEALAHTLKTKTRVIEGDLLKEEFFEEFTALLKEIKPDIRMLVNAAGFGKSGAVKEIGSKEQADMVSLNVRALTYMTTCCLEYMSRGSRIIHLASASAFCPQPGFSVYAATKSYVLSFSRSLRAELMSEQIAVTAVCPGPVATEFFDVCVRKRKNAAKDAVMARPEAVVRRALLDSKKGKELSVYGIPMKCTRIITKILPHRFLIEIMGRFW